MVVVGVIALLLAIGLPAMRLAREHGRETVCRSHLRQMAIILKTYTNEHDNLFPDAPHIYHSPKSFDRDEWGAYPICCRWHDARMGLDSELMRTHPELRGTLWPYLGQKDLVRCSIGERANNSRACRNTCLACSHDPTIRINTQYTYAMNSYLGATITTGMGSPGGRVNARTMREVSVQRETQVTRSPSRVFCFGEKNAWAMNPEGRQPSCADPESRAPFLLSGMHYPDAGYYGTLRLADLSIRPTYRIEGGYLKQDDRYTGDAFATYHRPQGGDLNTGHSYTAMLDGHVEKVTVASQLRKSRQISSLGAGNLGPGGNLELAWPLDIPPPGGWENQ